MLEHILKDMVELKDILGGLLREKMHSQKDWLVHKSGMGITKDGEKNCVAIESGNSMLCSLGFGWKHMGALEKVPNVVLPCGVFSEFGFGKVNAKFKTSGSFMGFCGRGHCGR
jgi:hypothetical protein